MLDFILGFILIWIIVALFAFMGWIIYDGILRDILSNPEDKKRMVVFLKLTAIATLLIIFAIKIWG